LLLDVAFLMTFVGGTKVWQRDLKLCCEYWFISLLDYLFYLFYFKFLKKTKQNQDSLSWNVVESVVRSFLENSLIL